MHPDELQAAAFEQAPSALGVLGPEGSLVAANRQLRSLLTGDGAGPELSMASAFERPEEWADFQREASLSLSDHEREATLCRPDGSCFPARLRAVRCFLRARAEETLWLVQVEPALRAASQDRLSSPDPLIRESELLALVHDLRNPLVAARISCEISLRGSADPNQERAIHCVDRAVRIVDEILELARSNSAARRARRLESCDLSAIVREALEENASAGGRCEFLGEPVRGLWCADELRRVAANLIDNALKYGSPAVPIRIGVRREGGFVQLSVRNSGRAMEERSRLRLFSRFSRGPQASVDSPKGWGIGLATVRHIAEEHGGWVEVQSSLAEGTLFTVTLPLSPLPDASS